MGNIACKKRNPTPFPQDPNAPKRAPSAYFLFANSVRDKVQKKYSGEPASVVMKEIGQMWKKCSDTAKFEKMAEKEKKKAAEKKKKHEKTSSYKNYQAAEGISKIKEETLNIFDSFNAVRNNLKSSIFFRNLK